MTIEKRDFAINSLLDLDWYKLVMGYFIFKYFANVPVTFGFTCRTKGVLLPDYIDEKDLRHQLDHAQSLRFRPEELQYLESRNLFDSEFIDFLRDFQLPDYQIIHKKGGQTQLFFSGPWCKSTYWETLSLSIMNEMYYRALMAKLTPDKQDESYQLGYDRLMEKIDLLLGNPGVRFSEFGTRRRFSGAWQEHVVRVFKDKLPSTQFLGTSNVLLAMKLDLEPIGTNAHELPMVLAGLMSDSDEGLIASQGVMRDCWYRLFGKKFAINLPDTFGSEFVFKTMTKEEADNWAGFRHDSGDPFAFGERVIKFYKDHEIDPKEKFIIFSDGLDVPTMIALHNHFDGRIKVQTRAKDIPVSFGLGTNATNDLGFGPLSLVCKAIFASGIPLVKLSDNNGKATGPEEVVARYKRVFGYDLSFFEEAKY